MKQSAENIEVLDKNSIGMFQRVILPRPGRKFVFDRTPAASYASEGDVYTCGYPADIHFRGRDIYLSNVTRDSGCYDHISAWQSAKWHYVD